MKSTVGKILLHFAQDIWSIDISVVEAHRDKWAKNDPRFTNISAEGWIFNMKWEDIKPYLKFYMMHTEESYESQWSKRKVEVKHG